VTGSPATVLGRWPGTASLSTHAQAGQPQDHKTVNWNGVTPVLARHLRCVKARPRDDQDCKTFTDPGALEQIWTDLVPGSLR